MSLLLFALYFSSAEARAWRREGRSRKARPGAWARWLLVALTAAAALVRLAQLGAADRQWTRFVRRRPRRFTSFEQVAQLSTAARGLAASLLFLLLIKVRARPAGWGRAGRAGPGLVGRLTPLAHRPPSSCASCVSGRCLARRYAGPCQSSWGQPYAWWYSPWPTPSWLFW